MSWSLSFSDIVNQSNSLKNVAILLRKLNLTISKKQLNESFFLFFSLTTVKRKKNQKMSLAKTDDFALPFES